MLKLKNSFIEEIVMADEKKVSLVSYLHGNGWNAEDSALMGAQGCFSEDCSAEIFKKQKEGLVEILRNGFKSDTFIKMVKEFTELYSKYSKTKERIFRETSGRGHGAVLDQSSFTFSIDNLSRESTLFLCSPQYASHLQQSLRRATAQRGFYIPEGMSEDKIQLMRDQFVLYGKMQSSGIPPEDARYILPLYTKTTIQTKLNARELMHLHAMSRVDGVPSEVSDTIEQMVALATKLAPQLMKDRGTNYETLAWYPSMQLFAIKNQSLEFIIREKNYPLETEMVDYSNLSVIDLFKAIKERDETELANLKHLHYTFLASMSIASLHQAIRQRTWDHSSQTIYGALFLAKCNFPFENRFVIPPKIKNTQFASEYMALCERSVLLAGDTESLGILPHSLRIYDLIHVNGWNAIHSIGKRTCTTAQWEIRDMATKMADEIKRVNPSLGEWIAPQGIIYGKCPEKANCGECET